MKNPTLQLLLFAGATLVASCSPLLAGDSLVAQVVDAGSVVVANVFACPQPFGTSLLTSEAIPLTTQPRSLLAMASSASWPTTSANTWIRPAPGAIAKTEALSQQRRKARIVETTYDRFVQVGPVLSLDMLGTLSSLNGRTGRGLLGERALPRSVFVPIFVSAF
jgi:hypothetical protein